jgi:hypothetical protein
MDKSQKNFIPTILGVPVVATSISATTSTDGIYLPYYGGVAIVATWAGSGTGTFTLQGCNDKERNTGAYDTVNLVNWFTVPNTSTAITSSANSPVAIQVYPYVYRWVRLTYTVTGGTIVLSATCQIKSM